MATDAAAGTLSLPGIVDAFQWWWLPWQIVGGAVFFTAGLAEIHRSPFDMPVADSEIIFGAYTEYTGLRFAFFLLSEYAGIVVLSSRSWVTSHPPSARARTPCAHRYAHPHPETSGSESALDGGETRASAAGSATAPLDLVSVQPAMSTSSSAFR